MSPATELTQLSSSLWLWQKYDPTTKADLFSTAIEMSGELVFVDPIPLSREAFDELTERRRLAGIVVTNANHHRDSVRLARQLALPIFAHAEAELAEFVEVEPARPLAENVCAIAIEGAVAGEIVLHQESDGGAMVVGDALINFPPYGFTFLPSKYCSNPKQMRRSLRQLLEFKFERMLFAHGAPLVKSARQLLEQLLRTGD